MKQYTTREKMNILYEMSISHEEVMKVNELLSKFNEDDMELINKVFDINFQVGFRVASELLIK